MTACSVCIGTRQRQAIAGFTLIELLVVIVLISIILSMATLAISTGSPEQRLKTEAQRFNALLQLAQDDALLNNSELGIVVKDNRYQFVVSTEQGWQPVSNNNSLRERLLPADMEFDLELDFQDTDLKSSVDKIGEVSKVGEVEKFDNKKDKHYKPQIYLLSSGEIAPRFKLSVYITDQEMSFSIQGNEDGSVKIQHHPS